MFDSPMEQAVLATVSLILVARYQKWRDFSPFTWTKWG